MPPRTETRDPRVGAEAEAAVPAAPPASVVLFHFTNP